MVTALSTGLFQVEAQRITLLATGVRSFTLVTARYTTTTMSAFLQVRSALHHARVGGRTVHQLTSPAPCSYATSHCTRPSKPRSGPRGTGCTTSPGEHCPSLAGATVRAEQSSDSAKLATLAAILLIAVLTERT